MAKGSSPALRIPCPYFGCNAAPGEYCTKLSQYGGGRIRQTIAHMQRRAEEKRTRRPECCCAGPDYHPDKPCPVHPKNRGTR